MRTRSFFLLLLLSACGPSQYERELQVQVDSLQHQVARTYKPGLGEFMSNIQAHHNKLWFAGRHRNWKLADFEIHEIMEAVNDIGTFQAERKESKMVPEMLTPALDTLADAIRLQNGEEFDKRFEALTNTCNNCHRATGFEFNVVKAPETPAYDNQRYE
ncbi:MAG: hypothetical protein H6585_03895 [Flavobacteriales bacterium]|nr:hypothetical protein [Flavobacteriales bacterium]MCB9447467.1 hypothetical protein [Flavobacteriales bacterium]